MGKLHCPRVYCYAKNCMWFGDGNCMKRFISILDERERGGRGTSCMDFYEGPQDRSSIENELRSRREEEEFGRPDDID